VVRAGGQPVLVPPTRDALQVADLLSRVDGVLIAGGGDVNPSRYGEEPHPTVYNVDDLNDDFEIEVVKACVQADKPLLAICRGHQVLNVALGGTLVQHIDDHEQHRGVVRRASIDSQSHVARAMGTTESNGLCWHHQAVHTPGTALRVVARASDGVIEAVEHTTSSWIVGSNHEWRTGIFFKSRRSGEVGQTRRSGFLLRDGSQTRSKKCGRVVQYGPLNRFPRSSSGCRQMLRPGTGNPSWFRPALDFERSWLRFHGPFSRRDGLLPTGGKVGRHQRRRPYGAMSNVAR